MVHLQSYILIFRPFEGSQSHRVAFNEGAAVATRFWRPPRWRSCKGRFVDTADFFICVMMCFANCISDWWLPQDASPV